MLKEGFEEQYTNHDGGTTKVSVEIKLLDIKYI